jgi:hypothetical protein
MATSSSTRRMTQLKIVAPSSQIWLHRPRPYYKLSYIILDCGLDRGGAKALDCDPAAARHDTAAILLIFAPTSNRRSATPTSPSSKAMTRANMASAL